MLYCMMNRYAYISKSVDHTLNHVFLHKYGFKSCKNLQLYANIYRLDRILSNRGLGSRTEVTRVILQGKVKIKGEIQRSPSKKYDSSIDIEVNGELMKEVSHKLIFVLSVYLIYLLY